jgi:HSP20 family molecular chaperone IbpA
VEASMKDGVLRLELRKVEAAKPRRIQISGS